MMLGTTIFGSVGLGTIIWCVFMTWFVRIFIVSVPEVTGLLTVNYITGNLIPYGTGVHFRFPWEQVKAGNYLNLRLTTVREEETYTSKDGPVMMVKWSYEYKPLLTRLDRYITSDDSTIKEGLSDVGGSILSSIISQIKSDDCKSTQRAIETELKLKFDQMTPTPADLYGIELVRVSLADVDFEPTVQAVRASEQVAKKLREIATAIRVDHPEISQKDAMNMALVIHGKVTKGITEVEGEGGAALAALLIAMSKGGGK